MIPGTALAWILCSAAQVNNEKDDSEVRDKHTYLSRFHNLTFTVPGTWPKLRIKEFRNVVKVEEKAITLCDGGGGGLSLWLTADSKEMTNADYMKLVLKEMQDQYRTDSVAKTSEKKLEGREGDWIQCEYRWEFAGIPFTYLVVFHSAGEWNYTLRLWSESGSWPALSKDAENIVKTFQLLDPKGGKRPSLDLAPTDPVEMVQGKYRNRKLRILLTLPEKWGVEHEGLPKDQGMTQLLRIDHMQRVIGALHVQYIDQDVARTSRSWLKKNFEENFNFTGFRLLESGKVGEYLRHNWRVDNKDEGWRYAGLFHAAEKKNYCFFLACREDEWDEHEAEVKKIFKSVKFYKEGSPEDK